MKECQDASSRKCKSWLGARTILENVSFRLRKGEHIALVGANGEGKSTFLNIITKTYARCREYKVVIKS